MSFPGLRHQWIIAALLAVLMPVSYTHLTLPTKA